MDIRRSRQRAGRPWICAAVVGVSLGLAGAAAAAPGSDGVISFSANVQDIHDKPTDLVSGGGAKIGAPGQTAELRQRAFFPDHRFVDSDLQTKYFGPADAFGRAGVSTGMSNAIGIDHLHDGVADLSAFSAISSRDLVTVTGLPSDDRLVNFHTRLSVFHGTGEDGAEVFFDNFEDSSNFSAEGRSQIRVVSSGIGPSTLGNDVFSFTTFSADNNHEGRSVFALPDFIDFDLTFHLGQAAAFDVEMIQTMDLLLQDSRATLDARLRMQEGAILSWSGFSTITDALTGEALCGLTIASATGVNYGSIAACQGGGGGGGDGGGGDGGGGTGGGGGAGGVPEPAAWALMIAGFGLVGARLRGRRSLSPAKQA